MQNSSRHGFIKSILKMKYLLVLVVFSVSMSIFYLISGSIMLRVFAAGFHVAAILVFVYLFHKLCDMHHFESLWKRITIVGLNSLIIYLFDGYLILFERKICYAFFLRLAAPVKIGIGIVLLGINIFVPILLNDRLESNSIWCVVTGNIKKVKKQDFRSAR